MQLQTFDATGKPSEVTELPNYAVNQLFVADTVAASEGGKVAICGEDLGNEDPNRRTIKVVARDGAELKAAIA